MNFKRIIPSVHGSKKLVVDPSFESLFAKDLLSKFKKDQIETIYSRYSSGLSEYDAMMRRIIWKAIAKKIGNGLHIGVGVKFKHLETFTFGDNVFIGDDVHLQGRHDGTAEIDSGCWIGPQSFIDARCLKICKNVGVGPAVKILGSAHTGIPLDTPIIQTELEIKPVVIEDDVDIGSNACILPGVTICSGSIIGASAVVTRNVKKNAIVAGIPAKIIRERK